MTDEHDRDPLADEQAAAAAREAAKIGGPDPTPGVDPAERPRVEGGEGYAEGFEQAEEQLERNASHEDPGADPIGDAGTDERADVGAEYGEADHAGAQGQDPGSQNPVSEPEGERS
ncbi:MAG TPA: hypothetical protein VHF90_00310 [Thermoleophilaceae bacterium]|nr:hypothetical protein [Thermoleophilaceae bacterium]